MAGNRLVSWVSGVVGLAVAALVMACTAATGGTASWQLVGTGSLNHTATRDADKPSIAARGDGELLLAWEEFNGVRTLPVRRFTGGAWSAATLLESDAVAVPNPAAVFMGSTPVVAWQKQNDELYDEIKLAAFGGGVWTEDADTPSVQDSKTVAIAGTASAVHLVWFEFFDSDGDTVDEPWFMYATYSGGVFSTPEPAAPTLIFNRDPAIAVYQNVPYVAYEVTDQAQDVARVRVRRKDGADWVDLGGVLNWDPSHDARWPSIAFVGATPYVGWSEQQSGDRWQVMIAHFDGSDWIYDSISLNVDPLERAGLGPGGLGLASDGTSLYVAFWEEGAPSRVYVKRLSDGVWTLVGGEPLNVEPARNASYASIAVAAGVPYVAFLEDVDSGAGAFQQVFVKAFQ